MKRKIVILAFAMALIALSVGGTLAYFTQEETTHNIITTGSVKIELIEKAVVNGKQIDFEDVDGVLPGSAVSKIVTVENVGASGAYVRVSVRPGITLAGGGQGDPDLIGFDFNLTDWTDGGDGWWYYNSSLEAGDTTKALFTTVTFDSKMNNQYQGCTCEVDVTVQAVQTANNGDSALKASGWPK